MTSDEITTIMNTNNNCLSSYVYKTILISSPQIDHVIYKPFGNYFEMWDKNGCYWRFSVNP